jgi:hypothetical protein
MGMYDARAVAVFSDEGGGVARWQGGRGHGASTPSHPATASAASHHPVTRQ